MCIVAIITSQPPLLLLVRRCVGVLDPPFGSIICVHERHCSCFMLVFLLRRVDLSAASFDRAGCCLRFALVHLYSRSVSFSYMLRVSLLRP